MAEQKVEREKTGYERFGLRSNPFRDLSSESLENVDIFHVVQELDANLNRIKEEVFYKENKAFIAILGGLGAGKTERLLLAANEGRKQNAFVVFQSMSMETRWAIEGILENIVKEAHLGFIQRLFSAPKWYRAIIKARKQVGKSYDPEKAGRVIAAALNAKRSSLLLINDFHHLAKTEDQKRFLHVLHVLADHIEHGVMIMISCDQEFFEHLMCDNASLNQRINRQILVPPLKNNEACLMLAKRILEKRLVDDVDPLYPFTPDAVGFLNEDARGNPRQLLKSADVTIDYAAKKRAIMIDEELIREMLVLGKNQQLNINMEALIVDSESDLHKKPEKSVVLNIEEQISDLEHAVKHTTGSKRSKPDAGKSHELKNKASATEDIGDRVSKMKCPQCNKLISMALKDEDDVIQCPYCDFIGSIS